MPLDKVNKRFYVALSMKFKFLKHNNKNGRDLSWTSSVLRMFENV